MPRSLFADIVESSKVSLDLFDIRVYSTRPQAVSGKIGKCNESAKRIHTRTYNLTKCLLLLLLDIVPTISGQKPTHCSLIEMFENSAGARLRGRLENSKVAVPFCPQYDAVTT